MKLIESKVELIEQGSGLDGIYKQIELAGRNCYRSEDKITEDSAKEFVDRMIKLQHCYTGDSEVLTNKGWIKWKDYNGEAVATVTESGNFNGFEIPQNIIKKTYTGKFYCYNTLGLKVTDGHRMFGMFANKSEDRHKEFRGELFKCNTEYQDANKKTKTLGERWFKTQCSCTYFNNKMNPFYQLIGFWLGDGCRNYEKDCIKFHIKKQRKVEYLTSLCTSLNYSFKYSHEHFIIYCDGLGETFNDNFVFNSEKYIDLDYTLNLDEIYSIIDGMLSSDGSFQKTGITYTSTSPHLINYICVNGPLVGLNVSVGKWKKELIDGCKQVERVFILKSNYKIVNDSRKPSSRVIVSEETEDVYCVTVSTGLILVRGINKTTTICGNCAMLEHGTVYLRIKHGLDTGYSKYKWNKYSKLEYASDEYWYVTTNLRVLVENNWMDDLQYLCEPTEQHERRITARFTCDRGVSHELVRHRVMSFAQESQRYVGYDKEKHGGEVTFIKPHWYNDFPACLTWLDSLKESERRYLELREMGVKPQDARGVLPNATKTEIVVTGFESDWKHFFDLRTSGAAHPDMRKLALELKDLMYGSNEEQDSDTESSRTDSDASANV